MVRQCRRTFVTFFQLLETFNLLTALTEQNEDVLSFVGVIWTLLLSIYSLVSNVIVVPQLEDSLGARHYIEDMGGQCVCVCVFEPTQSQRLMEHFIVCLYKSI